MELEVIREVGDAQLSALTALFDAARQSDHHEPLGEHKWLDLVHGGRRAFAGVVGRHGDDVVGYAHLSRHERDEGAHWGLEVVVHPAHRDDSVESSLVSRVLDEVAAEGGGHLHWWVFQPEERHDRVAAQLGFKKGRDLLHMKVPLPLSVKPKLPDGVRLRSFEVGRDEDEWIAVNNRAFNHHPEQGAWDRETLDRRMAEEWFDPEGFLLAEDDTGIVGFCWTKINPECGEIYVVGVDPSRHGAGLGGSLTVAGLEHMARKGVTAGCLYVDAAQEAPLSMYRKLGFADDHVDRAYIKDV